MYISGDQASKLGSVAYFQNVNFIYLGTSLVPVNDCKILAYTGPTFVEGRAYCFAAVYQSTISFCSFSLHRVHSLVYRFIIDQFLVRGNLLTDKLMSQGFQLSRLQAAFRKFYGRYNDLICPYNLSLGNMLSDMFHTNRNRAHGGCDRSTGDAYSSMAPDPTSDIFRGPCAPIL
jgi:hypothetical protein